MADTAPIGSTCDTLGDEERAFAALGLAIGDVLVGKYRIERVLGRGAMGVVTAATHLALGERVAIKLLAPDAQGKTSSIRFEREARAAARIRSEHVVRVADVGALDTGVPFIVMEYLDGVSVSDAIRAKRIFPVDEAIQIVVEVCHALAAAHALGIVHRDLKPSNLFLARQLDGSSLVKVLDFGISKFLAGASETTRLTSASAVLGSPHYMSPEQIQNPREVDPRADLWSLGVILYELIVGRRPFEGASRSELFASISVDAPVPVRDLRPDVPAEIETTIMACLEKDPHQRIGSMAELALRLAPFGGSRSQWLAEQIQRIASGRKAESSAEPPVHEVSDGETRSETAILAGESAPDRLSATVSDPLIGRMLADRFQLVRAIGRGAMGVVYEATDQAGERMAVKLLRPDAIGDPGARARLLQEARAASELSDEHVVRLYEIGVDVVDGRPFLVMEMLRGRDLEKLLGVVGAMPPVAVARIFLQASRGLRAAHARWLIHRDIKPANLFLHEIDDGEVVIKLCDFGVAKRIDATTLEASARVLTQTGFMIGSPAYMSPEQIKNPSRIDARTDLWGLCVSMYEALSGRHPWAHCSTLGELIVAVCTEDIEPLDKVAPWLDRRLVDVVHRGLMRAPDERWQTADQLADALRPFVADEERLTRAMLSSLSETDRAVAEDAGNRPRTTGEENRIEKRAAADDHAHLHKLRFRRLQVALGFAIATVVIVCAAWLTPRWIQGKPVPARRALHHVRSAIIAAPEGARVAVPESDSVPGPRAGTAANTTPVRSPERTAPAEGPQVQGVPNVGASAKRDRAGAGQSSSTKSPQGVSSSAPFPSRSAQAAPAPPRMEMQPKL